MVHRIGLPTVSGFAQIECIWCLRS
jgi:hypothetical protein